MLEWRGHPGSAGDAVEVEVTTGQTTRGIVGRREKHPARAVIGPTTMTQAEICAFRRGRTVLSVDIGMIGMASARVAEDIVVAPATSHLATTPAQEALLVH